MEKPTREQLEILIKEGKLALDSLHSGHVYIVYYTDHYEFWDTVTPRSGEDRNIQVYIKDYSMVLTRIYSSILYDYHNLPTQKLKRLLDGVD